MQLETGIEGHSHWPSVGDFYSVTEDLEWQNQNILWRQKPGEVEKVRVKTCIGNTTMLRMQFVNRSRVLRLNEIQKNNRIRTASSCYDNNMLSVYKTMLLKVTFARKPSFKTIKSIFVIKVFVLTVWGVFLFCHFNGTHSFVLKINVIILYLTVCSVHLRKLNKGSQYGSSENGTVRTMTSEPQSRNIPSQRLFIKPNCLNPTTQPSLPSREWTICSTKLRVCVCEHAR